MEKPFVQLIGENGNIFPIIRIVAMALKGLVRLIRLMRCGKGLKRPTINKKRWNYYSIR